MNTLLWRRRLQYLLRQLGPFGLVGMCLLIAAVAMWLAIVRPGQMEQQRLVKMVETRNAQLVALKQVGRVVELSPEEKIDVFYKKFPTATQVPELLSKVYGAAQKNGLALETGEYALLQSDADRLARYRVSLPVKGAFPQLIAFMDAVLKDMPTVALESANFKREKVDDVAVDAKLVFIVFVETQL
ncbi:MAG: type 4a pilus biogenesis protein PilO [Rhodoferax sp.]|uniref:type 4a pilus biogenesis protein PilO n=1 Tax=Rhodoferax sp. TaxID=50421 RepID=UPI003016E1AA